MPKIRLDHLVCARGWSDSRTQAQALIMAGKIWRGTERLTKPGLLIAEDADVVLEGKEHPWVSRGGMKLAHGLEMFAVNPAGYVCADIGASTGGFTDVLLQHGAAKVYAVDVGHGQLDSKLRADPRVVVMEKTNARHLTRQQIPERIDCIVCDASFISLKTVLPAIMALATAEEEGGQPDTSPGQGRAKQLIALIKPQFEAGKKQAPKGVVRDGAVHEAVCADIQRWMVEDMGWRVEGVVPSPVTGPKGNREFLLYATKSA